MNIDLSFGSLFASLLFGSIGMAAWIIGRNRQKMPMMFLGVALMIYPWMVSDPLWTWVIGIALTGLIYFFR